MFLPAALLLVALTTVLIIFARRALRQRVDVTVTCSAPLLRGGKGAPSSSDAAPATAARLYRSRLAAAADADDAAAAAASATLLFSLPGPPPSLAPFVVAGCVRTAVSGAAFFGSLLTGGARQLLPSAVEGASRGGAQGQGRRRRRAVRDWLSGEIALQGEEEVRAGAKCLAPRRWFESVEARVVFEEQEVAANGGGNGGGGDSDGAAAPPPPPPPVVVLRARAEATVRGVPALLADAARAAVEQAHARLARDVATDLMTLARRR